MTQRRRTTTIRTVGAVAALVLATTATTAACSLMEPRDGDVTKVNRVDENDDGVVDRTDVWVWQEQAQRSYPFELLGDAPCMRASRFNDCSAGFPIRVPR